MMVNTFNLSKLSFRSQFLETDKEDMIAGQTLSCIMVNNDNNLKKTSMALTMPETLHKLTHLMYSRTLLSGCYYYYSHFPKQETEA